MIVLTVETHPIGPIQTNCYLAWPEGESRCWVIDPGGLPGPIIRALRKHRLTPELLVITHGHWDHFLGNRYLKDEFPNLPIAIHEADAEALTNPNVNMSMSFLGKLVRSPAPDRLLHDADTLTLGPLTFEVIHTPGHSPGGICLYSPQVPAAFVGDLVFEGGGVGRTDLPRSDGDHLYRSIQTLFERVKPDTTLYPGHGGPTRADKERMMIL